MAKFGGTIFTSNSDARGPRSKNGHARRQNIDTAASAVGSQIWPRSRPFLPPQRGVFFAQIRIIIRRPPGRGFREIGFDICPGRIVALAMLRGTNHTTPICGNQKWSESRTFLPPDGERPFSRRGSFFSPDCAHPFARMGIISRRTAAHSPVKSI